MNRVAWLAACGALSALGAAEALGGCSSSDATVDDADGGPIWAPSGTSGTTGSTEGKTSGSLDASADAGEASADSGLVSNPNKITCGATECTAPTQACCTTLQGAQCIAAGAPCLGVRGACDEKADCTGGDLCCTEGLGTVCKDKCGSGSYGLCKTNEECPVGTCYTNKCPADRTILSCTKIVPLCTQ